MEQYISPVLQALTLVAIIIGFGDRIFNRASRESNLADRVKNLENTSEKTSKDIETIKTNHLTHIQSDINKININLAEINTTLKIKFEEE